MIFLKDLIVKYSNQELNSKNILTKMKNDMFVMNVGSNHRFYLIVEIKELNTNKLITPYSENIFLLKENRKLFFMKMF